MIRTRTALVPATVLLAAGVVLAGCGSSSSGGASGASSTAAASSAAPTSAAASSPATAAGPTLAPASAVPPVTGVQGKKPTIGKATAPAPTGLLAHDVIVGTGAPVTSGSTVSVNYTLALYPDATPVQSSYDTGSPFSFTVGAGQSIQGFDEGVVGMRVGGRRELVIPPSLGYGAAAQQGIPANSTLVFVIDVVSIG